MNQIFKIVRLLVFVIISISVGSCLDKQYEADDKEAQKKYEDYLIANNYGADEQIGYGVYVKFIEKTDLENPMPVYGNSVLINYTGFYTSLEVFETTDSSSVIDLPGGFPDIGKMIYGPRKHKIGALMFGLDTALRTLREGERAEVVIPYQYAFGNYKPVVYNVELLKVIEDDSTYEANLFEEFIEANGFDTAQNIANGLLYKFKDESDSLYEKLNVSANDTLLIKLSARYAENYYDNNMGRVFYPRADESIIIEHLWGTTSQYPSNLSAIDSALKYMAVDEVMDITFKSGAEAPTGFQWGYGASYKTDDELFITIVPPYTPLHYRIELLSIKK